MTTPFLEYVGKTHFLTSHATDSTWYIIGTTPTSEITPIGLETFPMGRLSQETSITPGIQLESLNATLFTLKWSDVKPLRDLQIRRGFVCVAVVLNSGIKYKVFKIDDLLPCQS
jgi:hypothetical protein